MLLSKNSYWYIAWLRLGYHTFFLRIYFVCAYFFVDKYLCDIAYLEKLIHIRDDTSPFDILLIYCVLIGHAKQYNSLKTMMMLFAHPCNSLIICFIMPFTYLLGWAFYYGASYFLLNYLFVASVKLISLSMIYSKCLCFKW
jgi:hypothetical protein